MNRSNKIDSKNIQDILALTPMQEGMLFKYLHAPRDGSYFNQLDLELSSDINLQYFEKAWNFVLETNEMLRTVFRWEKLEKPTQVVLKRHTLHLKFEDLSSVGDSVRQKKQWDTIKQQDRSSQFDLRQVPFRLILVKMSQYRYQMLISNHHILYDGWSTGIILKEFFQAYEALAVGNQPPVPRVKSRFKEFIQLHQVQDRQEQKKHWQNYLDGFDTPTRLPVKRSQPGSCSPGVKNYRLHLSQMDKDKLDVLVKEKRITLAAVFYSAWVILLQKYCNSEDVVFGITVSGRSAPVRGIEDMVGLFINTIPLRAGFDPGESLMDLLFRIDRFLATGEKYEYTPLAEIYDCCRIMQVGEELFDSLVSIENYPLDSYLKVPGSHLSLRSYEMEEHPHYDLNLVISSAEVIDIDFIYNHTCFDKVTIVRLAQHYGTILKSFGENVEYRTQEIQLLSEEEKHRLLVDFNRIDAAFPGEKTIHGLFVEQVERAPDHVALHGCGALRANVDACVGQGVFLKNRPLDPQKTIYYLTYSELNNCSNRLMGLLIEKGVHPDTIVGIMKERSVEMIIGILGILKAGGAYMPIDPDSPKERIDYMLKDSGTKLLITTCNLAKEDEKKRRWEGEIYCIEESNSSSAFSAFSAVKNYLPPTSLAYVIYTSGSTGNPKGVPVTHANFSPLVHWGYKHLGLGLSDRSVQNLSYYFDWSVWEIFIALTAGASLYMVPGEVLLDVERYLDFIHGQAITVLHITPTHFQSLISVQVGQRLSTLRYLCIGAEKLTYHLAERSYGLVDEKCRVYNMYGPTEATIMAAVLEIDKAKIPFYSELSSVPIGKNLGNNVLLVLDRHMHPSPLEVPGELYIGGDGVARGYLNKPEFTKEKFDQDLWDYRDYQEDNQKLLRGVQGGGFLEKSPPGRRRQRLYITGDLVRWLPDGNIEFLGRMDHQVKIRGFRVELGEIENQLMKHEDIKEAVVFNRENPGSENHLCAFIISRRNFAVHELKAYLAGKLPGYMIPSYLKRIEKLPLTPNGKVDRKALMASLAPSDLQTGVDYIPPKSEVEKTIAEIWKELLGMDKVGVHDNFFDIGGNSLTIIRLNSRLKKVLKKDISMAAMFTYPTISSMADHLSGKDKDKEEKEEPKMGRETGKKGLDIAVIGMSCRLPGAKNIYEFWDNIKNGIESIVFFANEELIDLGVEAEVMSDRHYVPAKGILKDKEYFDASFFDYTPAEAEIMDPQMRLFHECCWEGLEDAGYDPGAYNGLIGLYAGASSNPLWEILPISSTSDYFGQWGAVQLSDKDYTCTRVGYKLGLKGPCITLQTACSTSLAAVDLACQGLLNRSCEIALAGGVSITMHDEPGYRYREGAIMSRDGHCRSFDARATGTLGGNGAGVVVLKSIEDAIGDRDHIYAVIKGSAVNNDGKNKVGYTAPGVEGQANVIKSAVQKSGIEPGSIGYIEAHGTGTVLGDPIEIEGLKRAFKSLEGASSYQENTCAVGSVKSNIGHLDAAAGIAGFIKTVLALKHGLIPPSQHFEKLNPEIDLKNTPFYIETRPAEWKNDEYPRRAGVSSFGIGGTNVHVVLEEAPVEICDQEGTRGLAPLFNEENSNKYQLILLSAKTETALERMTQNLGDYFLGKPGINLADAAYTLQVGRKSFKYRKMFVCSGIDEAVDALSSSAQRKARSFIVGIDTRPVIFMFPGQGSQYVNMGLELYKTEPVFREEMNRCIEILTPITGYNIKEILYPSSVTSVSSVAKNIDRTEIAQPLLFVFEYALAKLLINWGIKPGAMIGHSIGEYTAACLSGVFSLEDAIKLVTLRGRLIQRLPAGAMLSVSLGEEELVQLIKDKEISLAAVNGESRCVVSGTSEAMDAFIKELQARGCNARRLHTSHAFHSRMMEPILKEFATAVHQVPLAKPRIPYISNVTGQWITVGEARDPDYWVNHIRQPVQFSKGITGLLKKDNPIFVETGPGNVLSSFVKEHRDIKEKQGTSVINLIRHPREKVSDPCYLLKKIGRLWLYGATPDWGAIHGPGPRRRVPLPTYPFDKTPYRQDHLNTTIGITSAGTIPGKSSMGKKENLADWFYMPIWNQSAPLLSTSGALLTARHWWVFLEAVHTHENSIGVRVIKELEKAGQTVTAVRAGTTFTKEKRGTNSHIYTIDPHQYHGYETLAKEQAALGRMPARIIHLWGVTGNRPGNHDPGSFDKAQEYGFYSLLYLVKALEKYRAPHDLQLTVITDHMQEVTGREIINPGKSTVMGLIRVIPQEYPQITCLSIDIEIPAQGTAGRQGTRFIKNLMGELVQAPRYQEIALRGNYRWTRNYEPVRLEEKLENTSIIKEKGVYLLVGGFGMVGGILSGYLASRYKARLVLTGQQALPERNQWQEWITNHGETDVISQRIRKIQELEALGVEVMTYAAEVTREEHMRPVIEQTIRRFGKINGVIFSVVLPGGELYKTIKQLDKPTCREQFRAKVHGLLLLQELLKDTELDFLMVMSSISSVLGGLGLAAYTAANIFIDTLVLHHNRNHDVPWISVNWDAWQTPGENETGRLPGASVTSLAITPHEGARVFQRVLSLPVVTGQGIPRLVQSAGEIQRRIQQWINPKTEHREQKMKSTAAAPGQKRPGPGLTCEYKAPSNYTEKVLTEIWQAFFGYEQIGIVDNFFELGGDSLKAVNLASIIHKKLQIEIPLAEFFNRPFIETLAQYIMEKAESNPYSSIEPGEKKDYYELSSAQKRILIIQQMEPGNTTYNISFIFKLEGNLEREKLERVTHSLIHRFESFRTCFEVIDGQPIQRIHEEVEFKIENYDLKEVKVKVEEERPLFLEGTRGLAPSPGEPASSNLQPAAALISSFIRPFDLSRAPLLRIGLIKIDTQHHILMVDMHHIISDGASMNVLARDFMAIYNGEKLPGLRIQYKDFAGWRNSEKVKETMQRQEAYWLKEFAGEIAKLNLPVDNTRPPEQSYEGNRLGFELDRQDIRAMKYVVSKEGVTLFMVLLATYNILLAKIANQEEIIVGTPVEGRGQTGLEPIVGMFVNTLALRNYPVGNKTFKAFLKEIKKKTLRDFENRDYPFEDLVEKVSRAREMGRNPLFDTMFVLQKREKTGLETSGLKLIPYDYESSVSKFDITLHVLEIDEKLNFTFEYCTRLFRKETIERFTRYFPAIISRVLENPDREISEIEIISEEEKKRVLLDFNDTVMKYPQEKTIQRFFEEQTARTPDNIALVGKEEGGKGRRSGGGNISITYRELNNQSRRLARLLTRKGVKPDIIVGMMVERSIEMIVGMLGILKAGGAYLPIDPDYPEERINYMLKESGTKVLLKSEIRNLKSDPNSNVQNINDRNKNSGTAFVLDFENLNFDIVSNFEFRASNLSSSNIAYLIYTSGTSGRPKGVLVKHRGLVNMIYAHQKVFAESRDSRISQVASPAFDAMAFEVWPCLSKGAALYIADDELRLDPAQMQRWLIEKQITISFQPTITVEQLLEKKWPDSGVALKSLRTAGDRLTRNPARPYPFTLYNLYGPTEDTVWTTWAEVKVDPKPGRLPPIGRPVDNHRVYIISPGRQLQPVGIPGQLCIAGDGLARGYLNKPELTAEKFVSVVIRHSSFVIRSSKKHSKDTNDQCLMTNDRTHKFSTNDQFLMTKYSSFSTLHHPNFFTSQYTITPSPHSPLYLTGDLACWLPEGNIEFRGRIDQQVKIRGFRIEPGEIENQLLSQGGIKEAVVLAREDKTGEKYLCAYIVPAANAPGDVLESKEVRKHLSGKLPAYMIPEYIVTVAALPLTPNGKIDMKALPVPALVTEASQYTAPRDEIEAKLVEIWSKVLEIEQSKIGIDGNFFVMGGHSLKASILISRIHREFDIKVPLAEVFKTPSVRGLSKYIKRAVKDKYKKIDAVETKEYYPVFSAQKRVYLSHRIDKRNVGYNLINVVPLGEKIEIEKLKSALKKLVDRHESLRTSFEMVKGQIVQRIHKDLSFDIEHFRLNNRPNNPGTSPLRVEALANNFIRPFDLSEPPLFRIRLVETAKGEHILIFDIHHIITDGRSMGILTEELISLYTQKELFPLRLQFKDFSNWYDRVRQKIWVKEQEAFWASRFRDKITLLNLPTDFERPRVLTSEGDIVDFDLDSQKTGELDRIRIETDATMFMVLIAIYSVFLAKITFQEDILVGIPIEGRRHTDMQQITGMFVNTLVMRSQPTKDKSFSEFLRQMKEYALGAFENQEYQFENLVELVVKKRDASRNPIFDTMFSYHHIDKKESADIEFVSGQYGHKNNTSLFDLSLVIVDQTDTLKCTFYYNSNLFKKSTVLRLARYFRGTIDSIANRPGITLGNIDILPEEEKQRILEKIDKIGEKTAKTPREVAPQEEGPGKEEGCAAPATEKERTILAIWEKILGEKIPGVTADFFQVGGSSIEALLLVTEINNTFKRKLSITDIYENENIRKQAVLVEQTKEPDKGKKLTKDKNIFRLKVGSRGSKNIFLIHDATGEVDKYRLFCKELKSRDNYWGLQLKSAAVSGLAPQKLDIASLASEYIASIKQVQARGPYYLGGWSIGGLIAFEMARQLEQAGEHVGRLFMFDTTVPVKNTPAQPFTLSGELELINQYFQVPATVSDGFKATNPEELWQEFLNFIENDKTYNQGYIVDKLGVYSELISDFHKLPAVELLKYVNRFRSTASAGLNYFPGTKIKAKLQYYQAELSDRDAANWQDFFTNKIDIHQTQGNHFNMFNGPQLRYLIGIFQEHNHLG